MNTDCSLAALLSLKSLIRPGRSSTDDWRCLMISQTGGQRVRQAHHNRAWTEDPLPTLTYITLLPAKKNCKRKTNNKIRYNHNLYILEKCKSDKKYTCKNTAAVAGA